MEREAQQQSPKIMLKLRGERISDNPLNPDDRVNSGESKPAGTSNNCNLPGNPATSSADQVNVGTAGGSENRSTEDGNDPSENNQLQIVLYDPSVSGARETGNVPDPAVDRIPSLSRQRAQPLPSIGAFTVQCANCFKWRLIPTKEKYEEIREHIMEQPFFCETGQEWRPNLSCDDPADITQDGTRLWAIDKPSIAQPPPGWQRLLRIRAEGGTKFADVYYVSPTGKRLRSMVEIERHLHEHPEYIAAGISLAKFSFQIPRPLQENYVRKRPPRPAPTNAPGDLGFPGSLDPVEVLPISWRHPEPDAGVQLSWPSSSTSYLGSPGLRPETQSAKKQKTAA